MNAINWTRLHNRMNSDGGRAGNMRISTFRGAEKDGMITSLLMTTRKLGSNGTSTEHTDKIARPPLKTSGASTASDWRERTIKPHLELAQKRDETWTAQ